jgi:hypothetical protein
MRPQEFSIGEASSNDKKKKIKKKKKLQLAFQKRREETTITKLEQVSGNEESKVRGAELSSPFFVF